MLAYWPSVGVTRASWEGVCVDVTIVSLRRDSNMKDFFQNSENLTDDRYTYLRLYVQVL